MRTYKLHTSATEPDDEQAGHRVQEELAREVSWYFRKHQIQPTARSCKWCGSEIYWADAPWSRWGMVPVDVDPLEDGSLTLTLDRQTSVLRAFKFDALDDRSKRRTRNRYRAHFESCGQTATRQAAKQALEDELRTCDAVKMVREVFGVEVSRVQVKLNETA